MCVRVFVANACTSVYEHMHAHFTCAYADVPTNVPVFM
jgi:hypothetical protein